MTVPPRFVKRPLISIDAVKSHVTGMSAGMAEAKTQQNNLPLLYC